MNMTSESGITPWLIALGWLMVAAAYLLSAFRADVRPAGAGGPSRRFLRVHVVGITTCLTLYAGMSAIIVVARTIPAEAARDDLEFETGALSAAERLAADTIDAAYPEAGTSSDGSHFYVRSGPEGTTVRMEDVTLASCASVLTGLSRHAKPLLSVAQEMGGGTGSFRPLDDWRADCPQEGARADLVLRRRP
jgi:hypothetical protein